MKDRKIIGDFGFAALGYILLGIGLLLWPDASTRVICWGIGAVLLGAGGARIAANFSWRGIGPGLIPGSVILALGVLFFWKPQWVASILPVVFGLMLLFGAVSKFSVAMDLRRVGWDRWWLSFLGALGVGALGAVLLWNPFASALVLVRFIGLSLILDGGTNLVFSLVLDRITRDL